MPFSLEYLSGRTETVSFKIENIILKLDKDLSFKINNLLNLNIKKIDLTISHSQLSLEDIYLRKIGNEFRYNFILTNKFSKIKCNGMINNKALITFSNFKNDKGQKYTEFINNFQQFIKLQYSKIKSSENLLTLLLNCNINQDIIVHAHQLNTTKNTSIYFEGLSALIKIPFLDPKNVNVSLFIKNKIIFFKNTLIKVKNLRFKSKKSMKEILLPNASISDNKKSILVLIIGESARSENFSLYGYKKNTTPLLSKMDNVYSFKAKSCATYTTASLKCILEHSNTNKLYEILPNYLYRNDVGVIWRTTNWGEPPIHIKKFIQLYC